jgi:uncharacterized membrane protein YcaP (DUF421 family)
VAYRVTISPILQQVLNGIAFYAALVALTRLAGKRLAGQTTTFDLIVLISIATAAQGMLLDDRWSNRLAFVVTVFAVHKLLAAACTRSRALRELVRGKPRALVIDGRVIEDALAAENISRDELLAGLRRLGFEGPEQVRLAVLEETGHISAVEMGSRPNGTS